MSEKSKSRNTNIELVRIIAMLFIIMGHFVGQTNFNQDSTSVNGILITLLSCGARIFTNVFLIIGVWFMVDSRFGAKKILKLWSNVFFYSFILTTLMLVLKVPVSMKDIGRGYLPFLGRGLWFASAYITLMFAAPFLNFVFNLKRRQQEVLILISFFTICIVSTIPDSQEGSYIADSLWFWFVYIFVGYYKKEIYSKKFDNLRKFKYLSFLLACLIYVCLCFGSLLGGLKNGTNGLFHAIQMISVQYINNIRTLPNILCAFLIFNFAILCKEHSVKLIQKAAISAFSVYIVHQVPAFFMFLWINIYKADSFKSEKWSFVYMIFVALSLYIGVSVLDILRRFLEKGWCECRLCKAICEKIDNVYRKAEVL